MKTLKFDESLVPLILSGTKTVTWRLFDDKDLKSGDELSMLNKQSGEEFTMAKITSVREKKLGELTQVDFEEGHESYPSEEAMYLEFRKYYGDKVTPATIVKIIKFELI